MLRLRPLQLAGQSRQHVLALTCIVALAVLARAALLATGSVSFHADEAIVGLMARHILQGARPVFFYGQAYMGSLDAWLVALGFGLVGESVLTMRIVQSLLYLGVVVSGYWAAWRLSGRMTVAVVTGLVLAVPPVVVALYTTATLGGYNETLLLGNIVLSLGYAVTHEDACSRWRWAALGACVGLGFWTNALLIAYALPVSLLILRRFSQKQLRLYLAAAVFFFLFSMPWWVFNVTHDNAALLSLIRHRQSGEFEGIGIPSLPPGQRALGMIFLGWPTLLGMRFPWSGTFFMPGGGIVVLLLYITAIYTLIRTHNPLKPDARALVLGMLALFSVIFVASHFGSDPTGRYFLPLIVPLAIVLGTLVDALRVRGRLWVGTALVLLVMGYFGAGQIAAANRSSGFTTQFDPVSHISNDYDDDLIDFLDAHRISHGYTNYWIAFRLAFLSDERLQFSAALPYKKDLSYNAADNRYQPYVDVADVAARIAYINTSNLPQLDRILAQQFASNSITYNVHTIGPYHVYTGFSERISPAELDLRSTSQ